MAQHLHNGEVTFYRVQNLDTFVACLVTSREQIAIHKYILIVIQSLYIPQTTPVFMHTVYRGTKFLRIDP